MSRYRYCCCVLCAALAIALAVAAICGLPAVAAAQSPAGKPVSFINDVAPILKESCFACHDTKKRKGKLDMSSYESIRKGGTKEDPIVPGKPDESLIIDMLTAKDKSRMPPKEAGDPLSREKLALIERWIAEGAKLDPELTPRSDVLRELRVRWQPPPPPVKYAFPVTVTALAFTPDNKQLLVGGQHELTVWDVAKGTLVKRIATRAERAYAMVFLPDGKLVVAGGRPGQEGDVRIYNIQAGTPRMVNGVPMIDGVKDKTVFLQQLLESDDAVLCLALSPDGKKLASGGSQDRLVSVWDLSKIAKDSKPEQQIENHADWIFGVAFSPDSKHLLTASRDKTAKVWDLAAKESVLTFPDHQNTVYGVAVKSDGKTGISVGEDNQLRFWNAATDGKQTRNVGGHGKGVFRIVKHPQKPILVTCSADQTVRVWDADKGQPQRTLSGHTDWIYALAISSDGNQIASGSWNGEVKIWNLADGKPLVAFNASPQ